MSLVGRLEDLGLGEILQIVALSGKSGILHVHSHNRNGRIYFYKGKVVTAYSDAYRVNLGEIIVRKGYATADVVKEALKIQKTLGKKEKLGTILISHFHIDKEKIEECVIELIEKAVFSLFYWVEGDFRFELTDDINNEDVSVDLLQYDLPKSLGLNPQFLAMEGSRLLDEGSIEKVEGKQIEEISLTTEEEKYEEVIPTILLIDENQVFVSVTKKILEKNYEIFTANGVEEGYKVYKELVHKNKKLVIVISLIMAKTDESGILGGLELVDKILSNKKEHIIVISEYSIPHAEETLRSHGIVVLKKPRMSLITKETLIDQINFFVKTLEPHLKEPKKTSIKEEYASHWDKEIKEEFEIVEKTGAQVVTTPGLTLLKSMIAELSQATSGNEIILLILRLASEIMPRGVIFAIKSNVMSGLGQFGLESFINQPLKMVKSLSIPITGIFEDVINSTVPFRGMPPNESIFNALIEKLGGDNPTEIFLSPIMSAGKPIALFYGDNLPDKKPIRDTDALEIFFSQAGLTMERLLLEKKIKGEKD